MELSVCQPNRFLRRTAEQRPSHVLTVATDVRQKWGSLDLSARGSQFLHDLNRYELSVGGSMRLQLVRGLSLPLDGRYSRVRDQIYLPDDRKPTLRFRLLGGSGF